MKFSQTSVTLAAVVITAVLTSTVTAGAASVLITGKQIKDGSIGTVDLAKGAVTGAKVKDGSLTAKDFAAGELPSGAAGPAGPAGAPGLPGAQGPKGDPGSKDVNMAVVRDASGAPLHGLLDSPKCILTMTARNSCYLDLFTGGAEWPLDAFTGVHGEEFSNIIPSANAVYFNNSATFSNANCSGAASGIVRNQNATVGPFRVKRIGGTVSDAFTVIEANGTTSVPAGQYFWDGSACYDAQGITLPPPFGIWFPAIPVTTPIPADLPAPLTLATT